MEAAEGGETFLVIVMMRTGEEASCSMVEEKCLLRETRASCAVEGREKR
jgi:hypothetical protein